MSQGTAAAETREYVNFDRAAGFYDETRYIPPECLTAAAEIIADDLGPSRSRPFLDAGIGTGRFARHLATARLQVVGLDVSAAMLGKALEIGPNVSVTRADLRAMPFRSRGFGGCLVVHVLHLIADWQAVVAEIRRVLTPGASLYLGTEGGTNLPTRALYFKLAEERGFNRPHIGAASFAAILEYLAETGADVEQIDAGRLRWTASRRVGDMLRIARRNPYSHLWHVAPEDHRALVDELERRTRLVVRSLDDVESVGASFGIWRVRWSGGGQ